MEPSELKPAAAAPDLSHITDEKLDEKINIGDDAASEKSLELETDPFVPFLDDPTLPQETHREILTIRAILTGCVLGGLVNASNVYLGLKTGWTFAANLFGAIFGFAFLKFCSTTLSAKFPIFGGKTFGPKENAIVQTAASASGGLGGIFVSAIPALYQLKLLDEPVKDFPRLLTFTIVSAYYGLLFATPMRKFFIIYVARELKLIFPTGTATAMTIQSMHTMASGASNAIAKAKTKAISIAFSLSVVWRIGASYAPGILWDWHFFSWFYQWSKYSNQALAIENWGWIFEWTPAFIGTGMLVGLNPAISMMGGSILAWGIIGPGLVHTGLASGVGLFSEGDPGFEKWGGDKGLVSFNSMSLKDPKNMPSPRYWMLWPGVMVMICASFAELFVQYKLIWFAFRSVGKAMAGGASRVSIKLGKPNAWLEKKSKLVEGEESRDPAPPEEQVRLWQWGIPLIIVIIATCVVLGLQYHMNVGLSILAVLMGFVFAFLAIQCTGVTDTTPLTAAAKASQLVMGGATQGHAVLDAQRMNLVGGAIASGAASQSTDLVVDFRVGFLLGTPPRLQWYAQVIGSIVAMFLAPGIFVLFVKAYPCVIDIAAETCAFAGPSIAAWRAVAVAVTDPTFPIPNSSGIFAICLGILSVIVTLFRHYYLVGHREKYRIWAPNFMCVGLAFVLPQTQYATAMLTGSIVAAVWAKRNPASFDVLCYAIAAGMIAGEGMGGVVNAILEIAGIGSSKYGSPVGCPGDSFCG